MNEGLMFYEYGDGALLRDADNGTLEIWSHPEQAWVLSVFRHPLDPTKARPLEDEAEAEAMIEAGPGPLQPPLTAPPRGRQR